MITGSESERARGTYPPPSNMLFIVCTTEDFKIFERGWEKVDEKEPDYPKNVKERFGKLKWKT